MHFITMTELFNSSYIYVYIFSCDDVYRIHYVTACNFIYRETHHVNHYRVMQKSSTIVLAPVLSYHVRCVASQSMTDPAVL